MNLRLGWLVAMLAGSLMPVLAVSDKTVEVTVRGDAAWVDSGADVKAGETIRITADGSMSFQGKKQAMASAPGGLTRSIRDVIKTYDVNDAGLGALIGRFGDGSASRPFLVGEKWEGKAPVNGRLFLGINRSAGEQGDGSYKVQIERVAGAAAPVNVSDLKLASFPQELLDQIPTRVQDAAGNVGDRVNFVIIASRDRVQEAFKQAGWSVVDKDVPSTVLQGILDTIQKRSYVTMPMSDLMLFGRTQDFGYAQGDPVKVVASRHHFRLWQAPFDLDGLTVWAGAGTHDIGFDKDQRNGNVTHKIDPDVDQEREHIGASLGGTGLVVKTEYLTPKVPITTAKTAHGEEFHSDGRTLIIYLLPDEKPSKPAPEAKTTGLLTPQ